MKAKFSALLASFILSLIVILVPMSSVRAEVLHDAQVKITVETLSSTCDSITVKITMATGAKGSGNHPISAPDGSGGIEHNTVPYFLVNKERKYLNFGLKVPTYNTTKVYAPITISSMSGSKEKLSANTSYLLCEYVDEIGTISTSDHDYRKGSGGVAPTCTGKAVCGMCAKAYGEPLGHDLVHHKAKAPTYDDIGWNEYDTCTRCEYSTYEGLPRLERSPADSLPQTGDSSPMNWMGWMAAALVCTSAAAVLNKRK